MVFNYDLNGGSYEILDVNDLKVSFNLVQFPGAKLTIHTEQGGDRALLVAIGISYVYEGMRKEDRRYFACQISNCWHLRDGVEVEFQAPERKDIPEIELGDRGLSWEVG
ncbi:hypothetical protein DF947_17790 [Pedobacter paludis]|uniref:Uncharacterized protein n=2 Tax=Pedobacter paludis TaxID=2203212 RepID=A0A317EV00_9SPHI|nr:hypothetical protein DF947_17790 [Pedobacter paludis]